MAIQILDSPALFTPVYNNQPLVIKVESDKTTEEAFNFIFDLYVNGNFVNRVNLLPRPGTTETLYSPARILESYVSYDRDSYIIQGDTNNLNDVVEWRVECGEEYIFYWPFYDTQINPSDILTRLVNSGDTKHLFLIGDKIIVDTPLYPYFSGVHTVVDVIDDYTIVINKLFVVTPTNPGKATWADKRKTEYLNSELLPDPEFLNQAYWSSYGPDASGNAIALNGFGQLNWTQYSASTFLTKYTQASAVTFNTGIAYTVTYEVYDTYPALGLQTSFVVLGDTIGITHSGTGIFTETIICGSGNDLKLYGNSTGTGLQGITFNSISVTQAISGYSFNGVIQYNEASQDVWEAYWNRYKMNIGLIPPYGKFLTNQPSIVKTKINDLGSIGWINYDNQEVTPNKRFYMVIAGYDSNGMANTPLPIEILNMSPTIPTGPENRIIEFGVYPENLNMWAQSNLGVNIIDDSTFYYTAQLYLVEDIITNPYAFQPISEIKTFEIDRTCSKYEPVRFMFLNSLGQFDYYNATLLSRTTISGTRDTFVKTLGYGYQIGDRGKTIINVNSQENYIINTDWVNEETANWLSYEFFNSTEIYIIDSVSQQIIPIILDTTSIEPKKRVNDKLINYTFNYSKAVPLNTQRN